MYFSGFLSPNWPVSIVLVCSCLFAGLCLNINHKVKQDELPGNHQEWFPGDRMSERGLWGNDDKTDPGCWEFKDGGIWEKHATEVMLTSQEHFMSSRCYNYFTYKSGREAEKEWEKQGKERERSSKTSLRQLLSWCGWAIYWPTQDALCQNGQGKGTVWRRQRERSGPIWMTESEGIRFLGLIDNDIPAWAVG